MKTAMERRWLVIIFTVLIVLSFLFMWWMSFSSFRGGYREIRSQYYGIVAKQVSGELETSIRYGKSLDSFYNIGSLFDKVTGMLGNQVEAAVIRENGAVLYDSFAGKPAEADYRRVIGEPGLAARIAAVPEGQDHSVLKQGGFNLLGLPILDKTDSVIGHFILIYQDNANEEALITQRDSSLLGTLAVMPVPLVLLIVLQFFWSRREKKRVTESSATEPAARAHASEALWMRILPAFIVMLGILLQSFVMYGQFQRVYKSTMTDGARGILEYVENTLVSVHERGVAYEKMQGLSEYLTSKVENTPILWNIRISRTIADTDQALLRGKEWTLSKMLEGDAGGQSVQIEVDVSEQYMRDKMTGMLLLFLATMAVAAIIVFELTGLPDMLLFRRSPAFRSAGEEGLRRLAPVLRMGAFLSFMGVYASFPYSSVLLRQWGKTIPGLSVDVVASLPITAELLTIMLFSLVLPALLKRRSLRGVLLVSFLLLAAGNALCAFVTGPWGLIALRVVCGIGFAGMKQVTNSIIARGSDGGERTGQHIAAMNAGLLGGIMCGGSLGAVVANSLGLSFAYGLTAVILVAHVLLLLRVVPWHRLMAPAPEPEHEKIVRTRDGAEEKVMTADSGKKFRKDAAGPAERSDLGSGVKKESKKRFPVNAEVFRYLLLVTVPLNLGLMFIVAFIPAYIQDRGLPILLVSYAYLVNGLAGIYLGPVLARYLTRKLGKNAGVGVMLGMGAVSLLLLSLRPEVAAILMSTAVMGLFDGFGTPVSMDCFMSLPSVRGRVDVASALAVLGVAGSAIQMISPMAYNFLIMDSRNEGSGMPLLGAGFLLFALLFGVMSRKGAKKTA